MALEKQKEPNKKKKEEPINTVDAVTASFSISY